MHVELISDSYLYNLFKIKEKEILILGFPNIRADFIEKMEIGYKQLLNSKAIEPIIRFSFNRK